MAQHYEAAGVNLEAGYEVVSRIKSHVKSTNRFGSMGSIGSFGGMFDLSALQIKEPVLVSGTDGVGTKLKLAFAMDKHDTIGIDAVAMCVNDVLAQGAEPLIFLDYVAIGHNIPEKVEAIVAGVAEGCRQAGCALVGGETAEMPGMYGDGEYDIAGYTTGVVEKSQLIDGSKVAVGDVLVGISSSGVHSNGYTLARKVAEENGGYATVLPSGRTVGEALLTPTRIYSEVLDVCRQVEVHGMCHVTGGGLLNFLRISDLGFSIEDPLEVPEILQWIAEKGQLSENELYRTFNMGMGFAFIVAPENAEKLISLIPGAKAVGHVIEEHKVLLRGQEIN